MKQRIKILGMLIMIITAVFNMSSCKPIEEQIIESGDFQYIILGETNYVAIYGLTEEGKQKETLVIPKTIDGYNVKTLGYQPAGVTWFGGFESENLKKVYILNNIENGYEDIFNVCKNVEQIILVVNNLMRQRYYKLIDDDSVTIKYYMYEPSYFEELSGNFSYADYTYAFPANVIYRYNHKEIFYDDIYWTDDYDNEYITYIPEAPQREGYEFVGWYKEKECINEWSFIDDIVPEKIIRPDGNRYIYEYKATVLYAKWEIRG